ncbi:MAG: DUF3102 domain-containing protein [Oscillospiraceae bacterium]|nr:DUF3102 domain-containing protein [Oscillospiraceae bacterium]
MDNNEIIKQAEAIPQERAAALTSRINANARIAAETLVAIGRDLKAMRDEKLYTALGCADFGEYCDKHTDIRQRQAYNFIKCYETYGKQLSELSGIGVTKLTLMTVLDEEDREELISSGDAENLSARELQEKIDELKSKYKQLTLDYGQVKDAKQDAEQEVDKLIAKMKALAVALKEEQEKNKELESRPVEVAVQNPSDEEIKKIQDDAQKAAEKKLKAAEKQHEKEIKELREDLEKAHNAKLVAVGEKIEEIERLKSENAVLQSNAKNMKVPDETKARVKFYISQIQNTFTEVIKTISEVENEDEKDKYKTALEAVVKQLGGAVDEL